MPGLNSGLDAANPVLVAAFRSALLHQAAIIALIFALLLMAHGVGRRWRAQAGPPVPPASPAEPKARRFLRVSFGLLWIFDAILQAQPKMAGGLTSQVVEPAAASSPRWVQDVVNAGGTVWSYHPVQAASAAVWIEAGLGLWLIVATGWWSRLAGLGSVIWGLTVWVFGEAFGGIFAPGLTWLTGAPGAVLIYVAAGALITLPLRAWAGPRLGRLTVAGTGVFWTGMAALQAWPGRGFWQGGSSGTLVSMVQSMAQASQPHVQATLISAFASFTSAHALAVNLVAVLALGAIGLALATARPRLLRLAIPLAAVLCLADWVLVQDFGIPGGLGTDPNSMVPWVLLLSGGYLAITDGFPERAVAPPARFRLRGSALGPGALRVTLTSAGVRSVTTVGALGVVLVGVAPMATATAARTADPIVAQALAGASAPLDRSAPGFRLVSQAGQPVSLGSLRGKVVLLTFLDPVCSDCLAIAREMKAADAVLGAFAGNVELVAIAADSTHFRPAFIAAFDRQGGLATVPNWLFLTGTLDQLQRVWDQYETVTPDLMAGMTPRSDVIFVVGRGGRIRGEINDAAASASAAARSSFPVLLAEAARQAGYRSGGDDKS